MYKGIFEMFDVKVRRLRNGDKLSLALETAADTEVEKELIDYRGETVKAFICDKPEDGKKPKRSIENFFEVFEIRYRHLKNGSKLRLTLEVLYDKKAEVEAVQMRFDTVELSMEKQQPELPIKDGDELTMEDGK